jgi:hypothetical protein
MVKRFKFLLLAVLVVSLSSCALFHKPDAAFVAGVDAGLSSGSSNADILGKYDAYVDADPKLTADTKRIEHATTAALRKLVADAKAK